MVPARRLRPLRRVPGRRRTPVLALASIVCVTLVAPAARAADGFPLCIAPGNQSWPSATTSGSHYYIAWQDERRGGGLSDIYVAQAGIVIAARTGRASGELQGGWPVDGTPACASGTAGRPFALPADSGSVLVLWADARTPRGVYAQRLRVDGSLAAGFPADGKQVGGLWDVARFAACSDGDGGAYFIRTHPVSPEQVNVHVHRVDGNGDPASGWAFAGLAVASGWSVEAVDLHPDPSGGAIFSAQLYYNLQLDFRVTRVGRVSPDGAVTLQEVLPAWRSAPSLPGVIASSIVADREGGVFAAWNDGLAPVCYAQHWNGAGDPMWPDSLASPLLGPPVPDLAGGAYLVGSAKDSPGRLAVLRRDGAGAVAPAWNPDGVTLANPVTLGAVRSRGGGTFGVQVLWAEDRGAGEDFDLRVSGVRPDGVIWPGYPIGGEAICDMPGDQGNPTHPDHLPFLAWEDGRNLGTTGRDLYATYYVGPVGQGDVPSAQVGALAIRSVIPNPSRGAASIALALAPGEPARLELVDVRGRIVQRQDLGVGTAAALVATRGLPAGLYFVRVLQGDSSASARLVVVE